MRYSPEHKASVRARIVEATARALGGAGLDGVGIPALMKSVGLTHGGFYSHFEDRDELVAEAIAFSANRTAAHVFVEAKDRTEMLDRYLSVAHIDHPAQGCVLAAVGTEARRQEPGVRRIFGEMARGFLRHVDAKLRPTAARTPPSDEALALASQMIGAVVLARLVDDAALGRRILAAVRRAPV